MTDANAPNGGGIAPPPPILGMPQPQAPPPPQPPPAPQPTPTPTVTQPSPAPVVQIHAADWHETQSQLAELREYRARIEAEALAKQNEAIRLAAEKANAVDELQKFQAANELRYAEMKTKHDKLEREVLDEALENALASALGGVDLAGVDPAVTARQVKKLLAAEIEAVRDATGKRLVRNRTTYEPAAEYLAKRLADPEYAVFVKPRTKGGSGAETHRTVPNVPNGAPTPGSLESIVEDWNARQAQFRSFGLRGQSKQQPK
jgi:hypothetical protein